MPTKNGYVYPFGYSVMHAPGYHISRVDQGVDFETSSASVGQGILAVGPGTYLGSVPDPGGFGPTEIAYRLDSAQGLPSDVIFVGHARSVGLAKGAHVAAGQPVALIAGGGAYGGAPGHVEIGFGTSDNPFQPLGHAQAQGRADHYTDAGQAFANFLNNTQVSTQTGDVGGGELIPGSGNIGPSGNSPTKLAKGLEKPLGIDALINTFGAIGGAIRWITSGKNLTRIAEVIMGAVLLLLGLGMMGKAGITPAARFG